jgi:hypothetical protein
LPRTRVPCLVAINQCRFGKRVCCLGVHSFPTISTSFQPLRSPQSTESELSSHLSTAESGP